MPHTPESELLLDVKKIEEMAAELTDMIESVYRDTPGQTILNNQLREMLATAKFCLDEARAAVALAESRRGYEPFTIRRGRPL